MSDTPFKLGTFQAGNTRPFLGLVLNGCVYPVAESAAAMRLQNLTLTGSLLDVLEDWETAFKELQKIASVVSKDVKAAMSYALGELRTLPPVQRPSKVLMAAANYNAHLAEMRTYTQTGGNVDPDKVYSGDKTNSKPYLFFKSPSALTGAFDDVLLPRGDLKIDWEAELAVVIGRRAKHVKAAEALDYVAGYMTFNDISCRGTLFREDRPNFRTDWMSSKSFDTFGPVGPYFVPRAFVPNYADLRIRLWINGELKQDGLAGDMIFNAQEQIEFASSTMTLEPGDIFVTGTVGGVGQGSGAFLKEGDVIETEIEGLGRQRNKVSKET
jgi:2,4-diketo-3-deoxy-L-fuconate hydrolase